MRHEVLRITITEINIKKASGFDLITRKILLNLSTNFIYSHIQHDNSYEIILLPVSKTK